MSIPPVLAVPSGRAVGHLKRIGARGLLALLAAAVIMLVSVLGALLPDATLPLTWYVPVLDSAMLVTLAVVLFLSSSDVIIRRHGRLLPLAFVSVVLGMVWLQHMLTFPGVAPFTLPLVTNQTAPFLSVETMVFMFMQARYDGFWYVGHGLMLLPCVALLVGTIGLYTAARRDAEVQLRVVEQLKASQQRLQVIIDTSPSAVISADETGLITGWNRKAEEIFGWSHDEAVGRTLTGTIIPRRYRDAHQRGLARFIETGEGRLVSKTVELAGLHRDGHEFPVEVSVSATSRSGSRVGFVAFINDVSQRRMGERLRGVQFAVTRPLANAATWAEAAPQVLRGICETLGWAAGEFWRVDKDANVLRWECGWHRPSKDFGAFLAASQELTYARTEGLLGRVWRTGRAASIDDVAAGDSPRAWAASRAGLHAKFAFAVTNGRKVTGVIALFSHDRRSLDRAMPRVMADIGSQIGQSIERRRAADARRRG